MLYLKEFVLLTEDMEYNLILNEKRRIYNNVYPCNIFTTKSFRNITFSPITLFYGENGSGKTTLLHIIGKKIGAEARKSMNKGKYFDDYVASCSCNIVNTESLEEIKVVSSDDVFDYLLDVEAINSHINRKKEEICEEYLKYKYNSSSDFYNHYDELKNKVAANSQTMSKFTRDRIGNNNIISHSNGETALLYWERAIKENGIYILDEPENSLSASNILKLKKFIEDSMRFFNCQFIISTHSPFLLSIGGATIYDLDSEPVSIRRWTELENVKVYYQFFLNHKNEFDE